MLIDELIADANHEQVLRAALDLADIAPLAARRALSHLRETVRPAQLPNAAPLLLERDWATFAASTQTPQRVRADILAAVAELLQRHRRFKESARLLQALPEGLAADLRLQLLRGTAHSALRQWSPAQKVLTAAVRAISPSTPPELADEIRLTSAAVHERLGHVSEALALLDPRATAEPDARARCLVLRALCLVQTGRPEEAEKERAAADALAPEAETILIMGTWVLLGARDFLAAAERAAGGLRRYPESDELSFLRSQAKIASGIDLANQERRVRRLVARLERADLTVLLERTLRVRADADGSLHYLLAIVQRAIARDDDALVSAGKAVARLDAASVKDRSGLAMAVRTLLAELLRHSDPRGAAAQYEAAGKDDLAEAYFLTSFVSTEPMGLSESMPRTFVTDGHSPGSHGTRNPPNCGRQKGLAVCAMTTHERALRLPRCLGRQRARDAGRGTGPMRPTHDVAWARSWPLPGRRPASAPAGRRGLVDDERVAVEGGVEVAGLGEVLGEFGDDRPRYADGKGRRSSPPTRRAVAGTGRPVRVLSVRQPWASAIIYGGKDAENRTWPARYRGLLHPRRNGTAARRRRAAWDVSSPRRHHRPHHSH